MQRNMFLTKGFIVVVYISPLFSNFQLEKSGQAMLFMNINKCPMFEPKSYHMMNYVSKHTDKQPGKSLFECNIE